MAANEQVAASAIDRSHRRAQTGDGKMAPALRNAIALLSRRERIEGSAIIVSCVINGTIGFIGLSGLFPFIYMIAEKDVLQGDNLLATTFKSLGITDAATAIIVYGIGLVLLTAFRCVYNVLHERWINRFTARIEVRLCRHVLNLITFAPFEWLSTQNTTVLRDIALRYVSEFARSFLRIGLKIASDICFLAIAFVAVIMLNPTSGIVSLIIAAVVAVAIGAFFRRLVLEASEQKRYHARIAILSATDAILGGREVRMSRAGELLLQDYEANARKFNDADVRSRLYQGIPRYTIEVIGVAILVALSIVLVLSGMAREEIVATLTILGLIAVRSIPIIGQVTASGSTIWSFVPTLNELHAFIRNAEGMAYENQYLDTPLKFETIELTNVGFKYTSAQNQSLSDVSFAIEAGQRVGIVGGSGAGKSTALDIIVGLLAPTQGTLKIDGEPLGEANLAAWRLTVGYVSQNPFLVDGTLLNNITFGTNATKVDSDKAMNALDLAGLSEFLHSLPDGVQTKVGDLGSKLSGGQRQRLAIARALYRNSTLLVFDEATSALDTLTEQEVMNSIMAIGAGATIIMVTHRVANVREFDKIVVLDGGRVDAVGTHSQLMERSDVYRGLSRSNHSIGAH